MGNKKSRRMTFNPFATSPGGMSISLSEVEPYLSVLDEESQKVHTAGSCLGSYSIEAVPAILLLQSFSMRVSSSIGSFCLLVRNGYHIMAPVMARQALEVLLAFQRIKEEKEGIEAMTWHVYGGKKLRIDRGDSNSFRKLAGRFGSIEGVGSLKKLYDDYCSYAHLSNEHIYGRKDAEVITSEKVIEWSQQLCGIAKAVSHLIEEIKSELAGLDMSLGVFEIGRVDHRKP